MLRIDPAQEALVAVTSYGFDEQFTAPRFGPSLGEITNPLIISTLSLNAVVASSPLPLDIRVPNVSVWTALPLAQPRFRGAAAVISTQQAADLATTSGARVLRLNERGLGVAPAGVIVLFGQAPEGALEAASEVVTLASPVVARLAALEEAWESNDRLRQQRERLTLMVDSLPDPVVITDASNDIIAQNQRAERLLNAKEGDSSGRRRAIELNNLLFTSFLSRAVMTGSATARSEGSRELNLVDPDEGHDLLFEVLAHPLGARVGPEDAVLSVLRDVTDLRRAANELERQV